MSEVARGDLVRKGPLISTSKLTSTERGGVGKELSEGYALNFAVGCTHGCVFCYVDRIVRLGPHRDKPLIRDNQWGDYLLVPPNLDELIDSTPWTKWRGKEVMMSSTHDPYLLELAPWASKILAHALPAGVRFCIQTRSLLVRRDFDLLRTYADQVRLQVSVATMDRQLARKIEPRVPTPQRRLEILHEAKEAGIPTGIILAPIFPAVDVRPLWRDDLGAMILELSGIRPDHIYGESLHIRGKNLAAVNKALGEDIVESRLRSFDGEAGKAFHQALKLVDLEGVWWPEYPNDRPQSTIAGFGAP